LHDPGAANGAGSDGVLDFKVNGEFSASLDVRSDETARIEVPLAAGSNTVMLALGVGNFRPVDYGGGDSRRLSFSVRLLNLRVGQ
jgi:hypothetical protein